MDYKTRCDGKTHYTPVGRYDSMIADCDCKAVTPLQLLRRGLDHGLFDGSPIYKKDVQELITKIKPI